jgi:hypothetical protein
MTIPEDVNPEAVEVEIEGDAILGDAAGGGFGSVHLPPRPNG